MDKIFHSTFDFFSYAIPGCCVILSFMLLDNQYLSAEDYLKMIGNLQLSASILILLLGFAMGFAINPLGRMLYRTLGFKLFDNRFEDVAGLSVSDKYALLRELSPNNFKYVETWNMWCTMSHNLAFACILLAVFSILKINLMQTNNQAFWIGFALVCVCLFFLFLQRAVTFYVWAAKDINSSISKLHLEAKANKGTA